MHDRPVRVHKPTKPFEYHAPLSATSPETPLSAVSTKAQVGGRGVAKHVKSDITTTTLKIEPKSDEFVLQSAPSGLARRAIRAASGSRRGRGGRPAQKPPRLSERPPLVFLPRVAYNDGETGEVQEGDKGYPPAAVKSSLRGKTRQVPKSRAPKVPHFLTEGELTIEQWYEDSYQRINPDGPAYDEGRRRNLERNIMMQGYPKAKAVQYANWLMRCKGRWRPLDELIRRTRKGDPGTVKDDDEGLCGETDNEEATEGQPAQVKADSEKLAQIEAALGLADKGDVEGLFENEDDQDAASESGTSVLSKPQSLHTHFSAGQSSLTNASNRGKGRTRGRGHGRWSKSARKKRKQSHVFSDPLIQGRSYDELTDEDKIKILKRSLTMFEMVYGPKGPEPNYIDYEIDHVSSAAGVPRAVPKRSKRFYTQGHHQLSVAVIPENSPALTNHIINGLKDEDGNLQSPLPREVLTEDPTFGINYAGALTADEKAQMAQIDRDDLESGLGTDDKDMIRRAKEREANDQERLRVLEALNRQDTRRKVKR